MDPSGNATYRFSEAVSGKGYVNCPQNCLFPSLITEEAWRISSEVNICTVIDMWGEMKLICPYILSLQYR